MAATATVALPALREQLASLEDPILRAVSYRKDLPFNDGLYARRSSMLGLSLFDLKLYWQEMQRAIGGDYATGERPLSRFWLPSVKHSVPDMTQCIRQKYIEFLRDVCPSGDKRNTYSEAYKRDLDALWFLSDRIHEAGGSVGRTKLEHADDATLTKYQAAIRKKDVQGLLALLADKTQEAAVIERVRAKAVQSKLNPDVADLLFQKLVFPITLTAEALDLIGSTRV
jgi:chorismate mutase